MISILTTSPFRTSNNSNPSLDTNMYLSLSLSFSLSLSLSVSLAMKGSRYASMVLLNRYSEGYGYLLDSYSSRDTLEEPLLGILEGEDFKDPTSLASSILGRIQKERHNVKTWGVGVVDGRDKKKSQDDSFVNGLCEAALFYARITRYTIITSSFMLLLLMSYIRFL